VKLKIREGLPFVDAVIAYEEKDLTVTNVLIDTGSAGSVFSADLLEQIDLVYEPEDRLQRVQGVGGAEFVFSKRVTSLSVEAMRVTNFEIEIGSLDYGFGINGILGMNWLIEVKGVIDLSRLELHLAG
jgi:hypothetical protein